MVHAHEVDDRAVGELDKITCRADRFRSDCVAGVAAESQLATCIEVVDVLLAAGMAVEKP
jgi:hypothetical protein